MFRRTLNMNLPEQALTSGQPGSKIRMWFVPDEMLLKRNVDTQTGRATIVFDKAMVALKTESFLQGLPQSPLAPAFANYFNQYYGQFAGREFPVMYPNDATGQTIINVKIFDLLKEGMQAVKWGLFSMIFLLIIWAIRSMSNFRFNRLVFEGWSYA